MYDSLASINTLSLTNTIAPIMNGNIVALEDNINEKLYDLNYKITIISTFYDLDYCR